uniref:Retroviral envelope protein GP41-like domain-containing protein n=1 Tax=Mustela putorius furo TaxID=9669 RepID=M3Y078_MUSPF
IVNLARRKTADDVSIILLSQQKRDFGITAAIIAAVAASAAAATAAAEALATVVPTAEALNTLAEGTAAALQTQLQLNAHLKAGLLILNQRVDLLQEQVDILEDIMSVDCLVPYPTLCVTPVKFSQFNKARNSSQQLSQYLQGACLTIFKISHESFWLR